MAVVAVVGGQWGDEGKGKVVDLLGERCQYVVRYNGGNNAGHTVMNQFGTFRMHTVPSGIFSPDSVCVVGNGVVVNPRSILEELAECAAAGAPLARLVISDRAHVVMPYHIRLDQLEEASRGPGSIGTTGRGIGPTYSDKYNRVGIRMGDLVDTGLFRARLATTLAAKNRILTCLYDAEPMSYEQVLEEYEGYARQLAPYVGDAAALLHEAAARSENILLEGAQGSMLDVDFGTYPYVTSSSVVAGGGFVGSGLPPRYAVHALGVYKAYCSRVGAGPFPTELFDETGSHIREVGHEYGTTTGRPRRIGWFDAVAGRFAADLNGLASVALTRLDVLDDLPTLRICTGYRHGNEVLARVPASVEALAECEPVYEELPGWQRQSGGARSFETLPDAARRYVARLEELIGCPFDIISVGPRRDQTILRQAIFG